MRRAMYIWECHCRHALHISLVQVFENRVHSQCRTHYYAVQRLDDITVCCSIESQWQSATNCNVITSRHIIDCFISKTRHCYQLLFRHLPSTATHTTQTNNRSSRSGTLVRVAGRSDATILRESLMSLEWTFSTDLQYGRPSKSLLH